VEALSVSPLRGALFETFVVGIAKQCATLDAAPGLYHWRSAGGAEVDAVVEHEGARYAIEIKCKTELTGNDLRGLRAFRAYLGHDAPGLIVYAGQTCRKLDEHTLALPWNAMPT
jgi:predicted AAA+ superfamily ATPase